MNMKPALQLLAAFFTFTTGLFAASTVCATPDKVALQLKWVAQAQFAGYYAAHELGYYKDECLEVAIRPGGLHLEPETVVGNGEAQFGIAWQPGMLAARNRGVPLKAIAQVFQYSGMRLLSWKESGIRSASDLKGKKVAVWFAGNELELLATLAKHRLDPKGDLTLVPASLDMDLFLPNSIMSAIGRLGCFLSILTCCRGALAAEPHHYVFFNRDRQRICDAAFLGTKTFEGAQLKYAWRELERAKDDYDFSAIQHDFAFLSSKGKKLFIQLQDASFDPTIVNVPQYLLNDPRYNGGADKQYRIREDDEEHALPEGWVARRWDPAVRERFHKLLFALGKEFDGKIEGINLAETAVEFGESGRLFPKGFSPAVYRDAVIANMTALKRAFPKSVAMQYANFMPGEWLPGHDRGYLHSVYDRAKELKLGVGGPDLLPGKPGHMSHCYPLIREAARSVPTGIAVQEGNYEHTNPKTTQPVTIPELVEFATEYLRVDYIFWCTQEPFYSGKLIPFLQAQR